MADSASSADESLGKRKREQGEQDGRSPKRQTNYSDVVTILVGRDEVPFVVHKELLCQCSPFFAAACSREWLPDSGNKTVPMPSIKPKVFTQYIDRVYKNTIDLGLPQAPSKATERVCDEHGHAFLRAIRLYLAADILLDEALKMDIINQLIRFVDHGTLSFHAKHVQKIWNNTTENAGLRRYLLDYLATSGKATSEWLRGTKDKLPLDFYVELAIRQAEAYDTTTSLRPSWNNRCNYHDH
ncbi:hypothetical protein LTR08_007706 [Meristemomyces frigidus]|nr:hypothetical protein LTR08_007706 [Meristemomyces frigidus]